MALRIAANRRFRPKGRYMRACKLYVNGLAWGVDDLSLRGAFEDFGDVIDTKVMTDPDTGRSKGFGFVTFKREDEAKEALEGMDGKDIAGRSIRVHYAKTKQELEQAPRPSYQNFLDLLSQVPGKNTKSIAR